MTNDHDDAIVEGSGNVFADLGVTMSDEDMLKVNLAAAISRMIQGAGFTQAEAAGIMGIDQPKVSNLLRGRVKGFTVERLIVFVLKLGYDVDIKLRNKRPRKRGVGSERGRVKLIAA